MFISTALLWFATAVPPTPGTPPVSDDPDLDGLTALIEYALNLDPNAPDADQLPMPMVEGNNLTYAYPKDISKADISYQVEFSNDLGIWTPLADVLVETNGSIETRKASIPLSGGRQFMRLKITKL